MTGASLRVTQHHFFVAGAILYRWSGKNRQTHWYEAVTSALNFPFFEESLAELLRFLCRQCRQLRKLRKSRRIASFLMLSSSKHGSLAELFRILTLSSSKIGEVSQDSCVCKLADRQIDRSIDR